MAATRLSDVIARIADHPINQIDDLLPWKWKPHAEAATYPSGGGRLALIAAF